MLTHYKLRRLCPTTGSESRKVVNLCDNFRTRATYAPTEFRRIEVGNIGTLFSTLSVVKVAYLLTALASNKH